MIVPGDRRLLPKKRQVICWLFILALFYTFYFARLLSSPSFLPLLFSLLPSPVVVGQNPLNFVRAMVGIGVIAAVVALTFKTPGQYLSADERR